MRMAEPEVKE